MAEVCDDSDIDVAVVLTGPVHRPEENRRTIEIFSDLCLKEHCLITPFFLSDEEYREKPYAIFRNIGRQGVAV